MITRLGVMDQYVIQSSGPRAVDIRCLSHTPVLEPGLRVTGHQVNDFGLVRSGRVMGQSDRPGIRTGLCSFCMRFIDAFGERIRHLGISGILYTLYFHVVLFTSSDSSNLLLSGCLLFSHCS